VIVMLWGYRMFVDVSDEEMRVGVGRLEGGRPEMVKVVIFVCF